MADCEPRCVGTRPKIFWHLDLPAAIDHLVEERQARNEAHHRYEPRRARMRLDETVDPGQIVDARGIFDVGALRVLMALAKAHQRLASPRVIVIHRNLDDPRLEDGI